jgi:SAM-dependent methyltransferase
MMRRPHTTAPALTRPNLADVWARRAHGWEKWEPLLMQALSAVDPALFQSLALGAEDRVVDFACGTGEPSLTIARLLPKGRVLGIDLAEPMLEIARRRARRIGIRNVAFRQGDIARYRHRGAPAEAAISRFGLMFVDDVPNALQRMRAALRRGGRIAIAAWGPAVENPGSVIRAEASRPFVPQPPPDPERSPHPLRFGRRGLLPRLMRDAGFRDVTLDAVRLWAIYPDLEIGVTSQIETAMIDLHAKLGRPDRRRLEQRLRRGLARFRSQDGVVRVPGLAWVVSAKK